jgi:hypothetical protein
MTAGQHNPVRDTILKGARCSVAEIQYFDVVPYLKHWNIVDPNGADLDMHLFINSSKHFQELQKYAASAPRGWITKCFGDEPGNLPGSLHRDGNVSKSRIQTFQKREPMFQASMTEIKPNTVRTSNTMA